MRLRVTVITLLLVMASACKRGGEGDGLYPSMLTEFALIRTDSNGTMVELTTDDGKTYVLSDPEEGFEKDTYYRAVCGYVPDGNSAKLLQATGALVLRDSTELRHAPDATAVTSVWRAGRYINMQLAPLTQGGIQYWGYSIDSLRGRTTHLGLHHRQNNDPLSYTQTVYASIPLEDFEALPEGDSIALHIVTFKGERVWRFKK